MIRTRGPGLSLKQVDGRADLGDDPRSAASGPRPRQPACASPQEVMSMVQSPIAATGPDGHDPVPSAGNLAGQDGFPWHVGDPPDPLGALCVRTGGGDHAAFAALHDALAGSVTSFTRRGWIRSEQAERITDAVFVEVWNLARLQPSDGDVEVWIAAVAHRRIVDRNRFHFYSHHCGQDATMRR